MPHLLDNPIWHALTTGNQPLAYGDELARCLPKDIGSFVGLREYSAAAFASLYALSPLEAPAVLFTNGPITVPPGWTLLVHKQLLQLVYEHSTSPTTTNTNIVRLGAQDIPAMLALTALTNPGPFLPRTIEFGAYYGIFAGNELVAMAGERLQPAPYVELSAVCTHPAHLGRGHAARLLQYLMQRTMAAQQIPFLHVMPENTRARAVYERLGFQTRRQLQVYVLEKLPA